MVRIGDIQDGQISEASMCYLPIDIAKTISEEFTVHPGDLLIAMSGATTGKLGFSRSAGSGEAAFIWERLTTNGIKSDDRCDTDFRMNGTPCPQRF